MDATTAEEFLAGQRRGVLVTLRRDGRPQTSNIVYQWVDGEARISVTADRAKTANLRRDPRAVLHVSDDSFYKYVSATGTVELTPVTTEPGDEVGRMLLELHDAVAPKPHEDPDEFFRAMVTDRRLLVRFHPEGFSGLG